MPVPEAQAHTISCPRRLPTACREPGPRPAALRVLLGHTQVTGAWELLPWPGGQARARAAGDWDTEAGLTTACTDFSPGWPPCRGDKTSSCAAGTFPGWGRGRAGRGGERAPAPAPAPAPGRRLSTCCTCCGLEAKINRPSGLFRVDFFSRPASCSVPPSLSSWLSRVETVRVCVLFPCWSLLCPGRKHLRSVWGL